MAMRSASGIAALSRLGGGGARFFALASAMRMGAAPAGAFVLGGGGKRGEQNSENGTHDPHRNSWSARLDG